MITVNKSLEYRHFRGYWRADLSKTVSEYRNIPMSDEDFRTCEF